MNHYNNYMKNIHIPVLVLCIILTLFTSCCNEETEIEISSESGKSICHTASMKLKGGVQPFDDQKATRTDDTWANGARLYLRFYNGTTRVNGQAIYNADTDYWTVNYNGTIEKGQTSTCEVYYFENPASYTDKLITLTHETAIFTDTLATYVFEGNDIILTTHLKPHTGRLRWCGTSGQTVTYSGLTYYTAYNVTNNTFVTSDIKVTQTVSSDGCTPYIYGFFTDEAKLTVYSAEEENLGFCKTCETSTLPNGKSYLISIPTTESRNGWTITKPKNKKFNINGVEFNMIWVKQGTFTMGADSELAIKEDETPAHRVTLTYDFYIGETEVTQALWQAVMGNNPSNNIGMQKPVELVDWNECRNFTTKLTILTGHAFRLPYEAEWEYAARGGHKSKGYLYSGSNTIDHVAWYASNSNNTSHNVKTKAPNELGIYDMSGNVHEWCQDWYNASYCIDSPSTDPIGPGTGSQSVIRGGSWHHDDTSSRVTTRRGGDRSFHNDKYGFRIAFTSYD